jgi:hypothetical protein
MFIFVANMYPTKHSILRKLKTNPTWTKFIAGGILADGTSLWEDLQPIQQLYKEFHNLIDLSKLPESNYQEGNIPAGKFIIVDPATDKPGSDAVGIGYFEIHDAVPMLMEVTEERLSPGDTIREALRMALEHGCYLIAIEANAYQHSLLYWFEFICQQLGIIGIEVVPIYPGIRSKNARILSCFKEYLAGEIFVHPDCKLEVHMQITQFNPLKKDNSDNILDLLTYAPRIVVEYGEYLVNNNTINQQEWNATTVQAINSPF